MAYRKVNETSLAAVADAIRAKTGGSSPLAFPVGMVDAIAGIASGGGGSIDNPFISVEKFVVAASATNTEAVAEYFESVVAGQTAPSSHCIVAFIAKEKPNTNFVNNAFVAMFYESTQGKFNRATDVLRWRGNQYQSAVISSAYDCILNTGDELHKITINARGV